MSELIVRSFDSTMEVRSEGDGRTITGIAVPFNAPTEIREWGSVFTETFVKGSFTRTIAERGSKVKLLGLHDGKTQFPLGRATLLREDANGLYSEFRVSKTQRGDEALELAMDGGLDSFSIGFEPIRDIKTNGGRDITRAEVKLREVSLVPFPAYDGALVSGVRDLKGPEFKDAIAVFEMLQRGETLGQNDIDLLRSVLYWIQDGNLLIGPDVFGNLGLGLGPYPEDKREFEDETVEVRSWDAAANVKRLPEDASPSELAKMFAWKDPEGDPASKSSYKFPYHDVGADGKVGAPNPDAASAGIGALNGARGGTVIPAADKEKVYNKLAKVLRDAGKEVPPLRSEGTPFDLAVRRARLLGITI